MSPALIRDAVRAKWFPVTVTGLLAGICTFAGYAVVASSLAAELLK